MTLERFIYDLIDELTYHLEKIVKFFTDMIKG